MATKVGADATAAWSVLDCELDDGPAFRAAIGLIVLANDLSIESEVRAFLPGEGVGLYASRIPFGIEATVEKTLEMGDKIPQVAAQILPQSHLDVIAFGTTGGTMVIGEEKVLAGLEEGRPGIAYTTPITAALAGLQALGATRLALLTPYPAEINELVGRFIAARGLDIIRAGSFGRSGDDEFVRVPPSAICDAAIKLGRADVDAVFVSCTALRVSPVLTAIEERLGIPVVTSNQALAWHCLRLAGYTDRVENRGRLLTV
jgi:maleate isomerase